MRLQDIMSSPVDTVSMDESAVEAKKRMRDHRIHHLVVMDGRTVAGIISDRDLGGLTNGAHQTVSDVMAAPAFTVGATMTVREAANKLRGRTIGCLPIMDGQKLVGIITVSDLLELIGRGLERPVPTSERKTMGRRGGRGKPNQTRVESDARQAARR